MLIIDVNTIDYSKGTLDGLKKKNDVNRSLDVDY
jgi:hypothetical protein